MNISLMIAKSNVKERILEAMKMLLDHEGNSKPDGSYLMHACLRKDIMFRVWCEVYDEMLGELVNEGKVLTEDTDKYPYRTYALPEEPTS